MAKQYLDTEGVQQVWSAVDSKFMRSSGTATRPTYNGNDLALYSDIPSTAKNLYQHIINFRYNDDMSNWFWITISVICSKSDAFADVASLYNYFGEKRTYMANGEGFSAVSEPHQGVILTQYRLLNAGGGAYLCFYKIQTDQKGEVVIWRNIEYKNWTDEVSLIK